MYIRMFKEKLRKEDVSGQAKKQPETKWNT